MRRLLSIPACLSLAVSAWAGPVTQPAASGGAAFTPGTPAYAAGFWYPTTLGSTQTGAVGSAGTVYLQPFTPAQSITLDQVGVLVSTASGASGQAVVYVYGANTAGNRPAGAPLGQCTITSVTSTGFQSCTFSSAVALTGNRLYWLGWEINASATALVAAASSTAANYNAWQEGMTSPTSIGAAASAALSLSHAFGNGAHGFGTASDPSTYSPAMVEAYGLSKVPAIVFHIASVP